MTTALDAQDHLDFLPPPPSHPPPLLTDSQLLHLAHQGHLPLALRPSLSVLYAELNDAASRLFSLPHSAKQGLYSPLNGGTELGYVSIPNEKHYITFRALTAHASTELETLVAAVWQETFILLYRILSDLAHAMGTSYEVWEKVLDGVAPMPRALEDAKTTTTMLRIFRYEPDDGIAELHTDMGLLTLCVCDGQGLQVRVKDERGAEKWIEYSEPTLLVGRTLRVLSGNRVRAGVHRVVGNAGGRGSIVYALRPSTKHEIDMGLFPGGEGKGNVHLSEIWKKIWTSAYNVNAPKEVREKQKERQRLKGKGVEVDDDGGGPDDVTNTMAAITA
jgi:hypothetical protein